MFVNAGGIGGSLLVVRIEDLVEQVGEAQSAAKELGLDDGRELGHVVI